MNSPAAWRWSPITPIGAWPSASYGSGSGSGWAGGVVLAATTGSGRSSASAKAWDTGLEASQPAAAAVNRQRQRRRPGKEKGRDEDIWMERKFLSACRHGGNGEKSRIAAMRNLVGAGSRRASPREAKSQAGSGFEKMSGNGPDSESGFRKGGRGATRRGIAASSSGGPPPSEGSCPGPPPRRRDPPAPRSVPEPLKRSSNGGRIPGSPRGNPSPACGAWGGPGRPESRRRPEPPAQRGGAASRTSFYRLMS